MSSFSYIFKIGIIVLLLVWGPTAIGQIEAGIKLGANTYVYEESNTQIEEGGRPQYSLELDKKEIGFQGGFFTRLTIWKLFLQVEALLNSNRINYKMKPLNTTSVDSIYKEKHTNINAPLLLGIKIGGLNLQGGVTGHYRLANDSDFKDLENFSTGAQKFTYGYLAGVGIDFKDIRLDFRYELNTTNFGDQISYKGNTFKFTDRQNRFIVNLGVVF